MAYDERDRIEALHRKIQALERLAADRGASAPEADSARAKAARLRAKLAMLSDAAPRPQPFAARTHRTTAPHPGPPRRSAAGATASPAWATPRPSSAAGTANASRDSGGFAEWAIRGAGFILLMLASHVLPSDVRPVRAQTNEDPLAWLNQQPQPVYDHAYRPVPPSRTTMPEVCIKRIPAGYVPVRDTLENEWFLVPRAKHSSYQAPRYTASAEELRQRLQQLPCPW